MCEQLTGPTHMIIGNVENKRPFTELCILVLLYIKCDVLRWVGWEG